MLTSVLRGLRPNNGVETVCAVLAPPLYAAYKGLQALPPDTRLAVTMPGVYIAGRVAGEKLLSAIHEATKPAPIAKPAVEVYDFSAAAE